jgi:tetratricopeptide (TPR) repeat protein
MTWLSASRHTRGLVLGQSLLALAVVASLAADSPSQLPTSAILDQYTATGHLMAEFSNARDFGRYLDNVGTRWISDGGETAVSQRRRQLVLLALEVAAQLDHTEALPIVEWGCKVLRRANQASGFERGWFFASAAATVRPYLEKNFDSDVSRSGPVLHLQHARDVFPGDGRLRLLSLFPRPELHSLSSRPGVDPDVLTHFRGLGSPRPALSTNRARLSKTMQELADLAGDSVAGDEASARLGLLKFQLGHQDYGRGNFSKGTSSQDDYVRNLAWLGLGLALEEVRDFEGALKAYTSAVAAIPTAKSSAVRLAALLVARGRLDDASSVIDAAFAPGPVSLDPWDQIVAPDRNLSRELDRLRELAGVPVIAKPGQPMVRTSPSTSAAQEHVLPVTQAPGFRAQTTGVVLDVSVLSRNVPVIDLTSSELEVLDNGVPQPISLSRVEDLPLDISLAVDMFNERGVGNPAGSVFPFATSGVFQRLREDVQEVGGLLRSGDRFRLLLVDSNVGKEIWRFQPSPFPLDRLPAVTVIGPHETTRNHKTFGRMQALYDTVAAALLPRPDPQRRHLVIVFTDGVDDASVLTPEKFLELSQAAATVMYVIRRDTQVEIAQKVGNRLGALGIYRDLLWPPDPSVIQRAALLTGGEVGYRPAAGLQGDFRRIFERFRKSYVVRYEPLSQEPGWHKLAVTVGRPGKFEVKVRSGYWIR